MSQSDPEPDVALSKPIVLRSIGKPIAPPLVFGIIAMGLGSLIAALLGGEGGVLIGGLLSLGGIIAAVVGVARLGEAIQYLALRERDREHGVD